MTETPIPTGADRLARKAREAGWTVHITPATGTWRDKPVTSVAVRLRRDDVIAAGVWRDGAYDYGGYAHLTRREDSPDVMPKRLNSRELIALVTS